jgi:S-formylglutathione hydrolase FrmB
MHRRLLPLAVLALAAAPALLAQSPNGERPRRERREAAPVELKNFTFREEKFHSTAINSDHPFGIYLPKGYDDEANKDKQWPVVIWLHGMWEDHLRFHQRGGAPVLDQCTGDGKLPPCIFVTANGGRTSMYINRKDQRWEDLITQDLLQHLTKQFRASDQREQRAIMGVSMGGMAALRIAFTQPELFGAVGAHSSAVFAEDPEQLPERMKGMAQRLGLDEEFGNPIQKEPWQKANPLCIANAADAKSLSTLRIYFDAGTADRYGFAGGNTLLHEALEQRKVPHTWRLIEGGGHSWGAGFQDQTLPYSFAVIGELFAGKAASAPPTKEPAKPADATPAGT